MKRVKNRLLILLMTLCMVLTITTVAAIAVEETGSTGGGVNINLQVELDGEPTIAITEPTGGGTYTVGNTVTVTAAAAEAGYTFNGWYNGTELLSTSLSYTFTINDNMYLTASYKTNSEVDVIITGLSGGQFRMESANPKLNFGTVKQSSVKVQAPIGTTVKLTAVESDKVDAWYNSSDKVISREASIEVTVTGKTIINLQYKGDEYDNQAFVEYVTDYDQRLIYQNCGVTRPFNPPTNAPSKLGYKFTGWTLTPDGIINEIKAGKKQIAVKPVYEVIDQNITATVQYNGVTHDAETYPGNVGTIVTFTVPESVDGKVFTHWTGADGKILSYQRNYFAWMVSDVTLTAHYANKPVEANPVIAMTSVYASLNDYSSKLSFVVSRSVPSNYTMLEHGILYSKDDPKYLVLENWTGDSNLKKGQSNNLSNNGVYTQAVAVYYFGELDTAVNARGYMVLRNNETNNIEVIYSDVASYSFNDLYKAE